MENYKKQVRLNIAQRQAVGHTDGPLLVVAGPGTGKTQLLSARVANILAKTDVYPNNILCLTFTNKAADNMKQRLMKIIGTDAQAVVVKTFHSLAADIMNRYPEYFWRGARLSIAPDAIQLEVVQQVLLSLPVGHTLTLRFAGQFTLIDDVAKSISLAKEAGLTPGKLRAVVGANLAYLDAVEPEFRGLGEIKSSAKNIASMELLVQALPEQPIDEHITPLVSLRAVIKDSFELAKREADETSKTRPISKWKARWIQKIDGAYGMFDERKRNEWWLAVADAYDAYRKQLHKRGYYDYADMLVEVIIQIEQHEDLRANLQEQYQYVLIDEFQDTNAAQLRLAHLIVDHTELEQPNIMAVGDDDQSIFKFQGADLSNMLGFTRQYPTSKLIVLTDNYRSSQEILNTIDNVISHAQYRLVNRIPNLTKNLHAKVVPTKKGIIEHRVYRSREEHLSGLADMARRLSSSGNTVAVLARHHSSLRDMAMILHQKSVSISYEQSNNILELPAIEQLYMILKILTLVKKGRANEANELLSLTLRNPMWGVKTKDLWRFAVEQQVSHDWFGGLLGSKDTELLRIGKWLDWLVSLSSNEPLAVVFEYVLGLRDNDIFPSPIKSYYFAKSRTSETFVETLSAIGLLRSLVVEFRSLGISKIEDLVEFLDLMLENSKIIADVSPFVSGTNAVELLTVHKAKGLEFDSVILIDAVNKEWSPRVRGRIPPANLPLRPAEDDIDDYVRLMYVAASRAKRTLLFGSYSVSQKGEEVFPASSISEVSVKKQKPETAGNLVKVLEDALRWPRLEQANEKAILKPRLEQYTMNVSNLINFLDITRGGPQYFKERNLLRLPEAKTSSAAMGSAVHSALEEAQLRINAGNYKLKPVLSTFEETLLKEGLPEADFKKKLAEGKHLLTAFIDKHEWGFVKGARPEYKVTDIRCNEAKLSGTLDVLDTTGDETVITDYKTGRPLASLSAKSGADGIKAWRHKLQLVFYALLVDIDPAIHSKGDVKCQMVYVESTRKNQLSQQYQPSRDELTRLGSLIRAVWEHIMDLNLPDTSNYSQDISGIKQFETDLIEGKI